MKRPFMCFCILLMVISILRFYVIDYGSPPGEMPQEAVTLQGRLDSREVKSGYTILYLSDIFFYDNSVKEISNYNSIGLRCYIEETEDLKLGQQVAVQGFLALPQKAGNQGEFDEASYYSCMGYKYVLYEGKILAKSREYDILLQLLYDFKCYAKMQINTYLEQTDAGIMSAMLLGDKTNIDNDTKFLYRSMGIYHILAISGLHISLIGGFLYKLLKILRIKPAIAVLLSLGMVILYGIMIGMPPSALRAIIMFGFGLIAPLINRSHDRFTSLAVAGICLVGINPQLIEDAGVQLSFLAVLGIIGLYPTFLNIHQQHMKIADSVWISFAVSYITLPVIMQTYYEIPMCSLILNVCIVPFVPTLIGLGLLIIMCGNLLPVVAELCAWLIKYILLFYEKILLLFQKLPGNTLVTGAPQIFKIIIFYVVLGVLVLFIYKIKRKLLIRSLKSENAYMEGRQAEYVKEQRCILSILIGMRIAQVIIMLILVLVLLLPQKYDCRITFLDVGQGDGICIETDNDVYLIDCGSTSKSGIGQYIVKPFLQYQGITKVDGWFLTHPDSDHVSGFKELCERENMDGIKVETLYIPLALEKEFADLISLAKRKGIGVVLLEKGDTLTCGELEFMVISPDKNTFYKDENDASLVLYLQYEEFTGLFMGDAGFVAEQAVSEAGIKDISLLKVAHHGSAIEANSFEFIEGTSPRLAVISCGINNSYGHPHEEVVERLRTSGSVICRTDKMGQISIIFKGEKMRIEHL